MEQVFVLNTIIGNRLGRTGGKLHVAFVYFAAAFDEVNRETLQMKMQKMGIEGRLLNMLKEIYRSTWCEVITTDGMTDGFRTSRGVSQDCPLSPILFNIYINDLEGKCMRKREGGTGIGSANKGIKIFTLMYADDLAIVADTMVKAGALYGVKIWGCQRREIIKGVQARFVKACLGFPKNTPDYK